MRTALLVLAMLACVTALPAVLAGPPDGPTDGYAADGVCYVIDPNDPTHPVEVYDCPDQPPL